MGIFEIHFHDSEIRPSIHIGPKGSDSEETEPEEVAESGTDWEDEFDAADSESSLAGKLLAVFLVAVVVAVVAKKVTGSGE